MSYNGWELTPWGVYSGGVEISAADALSLCDMVLRYHTKLALMARVEASGSGLHVCSVVECLSTCGPAEKCGRCECPLCLQHLNVYEVYDQTRARVTYCYLCSSCRKEVL
jgi:hypothetical protein